MGINTENEALFAALQRITDILTACERKYESHFSLFFDAESVLALQSYIHPEDGTECAFFGGYTGAERCMFGAWPEYESEGIYERFPMELLEIVCPPQAKLSHRDCLGALLGLGIKREMLGDILCDERLFYVFASSKISDYIVANLEKIGSAGVKIRKLSIAEFAPPEPKTQTKGIFVMSNRLDAVLAGALDLSRAKAAELIRSERVSVNHALKTDVSLKVNEGELLSVRGFGRLRIGEEGNKSRKGRTYLEIIKYI